MKIARWVASDYCNIDLWMLNKTPEEKEWNDWEKKYLDRQPGLKSPGKAIRNWESSEIQKIAPSKISRFCQRVQLDLI